LSRKFLSKSSVFFALFYFVSGLQI